MRLSAEEVGSLGRSAWMIQAGLSDEKAIRRMLDELAGACPPVDVPVDSAGVFPRRPIGEVTAAGLGHTLAANLLAPSLRLRDLPLHQEARADLTQFLRQIPHQQRISDQ